MHVPVFLGSARLEIHLDLSFEVLGPLLKSASTIELGTEPLLGVYQHLPEIVQLIRRPHHVAFLLLKLQSQLVELGRRCLTDPRAIVTCRRCLTCVAALSRSTTGPPNKPVLLLARLVGQYCIAGCRLSSSVTLPAGGLAAGRVGGRPPPGRARGRSGDQHCTVGQYGCKLSVHPTQEAAKNIFI